MRQPQQLAEIRAAAARAARLAVVLDYDGTLVPIAPTPDAAAPDQELLALLSALCSRDRTTVHIVSGRPRQALTDWLGHLPAGLWAEHGAYYRPPEGDDWECRVTVPADWAVAVSAALERIAASAPGSLVERKTASIAWHYRLAEPEIRPRRARALARRLGGELRSLPIEILEGRKVIEVRVRGISKALVAQHLVATEDASTVIVAFGDDRTDEDLFAALPDSTIKVAVGRQRSGAGYSVRDHAAVRAILESLLRESQPDR